MDNHDTVEVNHPPVNEEIKSERLDEDFIFSFRRILAINSLIVEVAISALPLFTIPSAFCISSILRSKVDCSVHCSGHWWGGLVYLAGNGYVPCICCCRANFWGLIRFDRSPFPWRDGSLFGDSWSCRCGNRTKHASSNRRNGGYRGRCWYMSGHRYFGNFGARSPSKTWEIYGYCVASLPAHGSCSGIRLVR
jgi:hypothetical protein